jgi:molybdopterin-synthase adenylyltransferase
MNNERIDRETNGRPSGNEAGTSVGPQRLVALPLQLIEAPGGVIVRRGSIQLLVGGERSMQALEIVVDAMSGEGACIDDVCSRFAAPDGPAVQQLIEQLIARQFVVPVGENLVPIRSENQLDVFYWHFGLASREVNTRLNGVRVAILGVNQVSRQLAHALTAAGMTNIMVVDYSLLRNLTLFDEAGRIRASDWRVAIEPVAYKDWMAGLGADSLDCLVATSDFGGLRLMLQWNALCLQRGFHFLPVILQDMVGYVGPAVIPGETACFECFLSRMDSNRTGDAQGYASEMNAFAGQHVAGFHPSMASVLGDIAAIELTKFYSRGLPLWKVGAVMEVNLLAGCIDSRKVLRVPRCRACSNLMRRSSTSKIKSSLTSKVVEA